MRSKLRQNIEWLSTTGTALTAIAAATVNVNNLLVGTTDLVAGQPIDEGTVRRILFFPTILQGVASGVWHLGIMVQNNEGNTVNPRSAANDERWMFWYTGFLQAGAQFGPTDFFVRPFEVKVNRKLSRNDVLRVYYINTTASSILMQSRVAFGAGLKRG